jgi:hypothetical protein
VSRQAAEETTTEPATGYCARCDHWAKDGIACFDDGGSGARRYVICADTAACWARKHPRRRRAR